MGSCSCELQQSKGVERRFCSYWYTLKTQKPSCCCCIGLYLYGGWKTKIVSLWGNINNWRREKRGWSEGNEFTTWLLVCRLVRPPRWAFFKKTKDGRHNPSHLSLSLSISISNPFLFLFHVPFYAHCDRPRGRGPVTPFFKINILLCFFHSKTALTVY